MEKYMCKLHHLCCVKMTQEITFKVTLPLCMVDLSRRELKNNNKRDQQILFLNLINIKDDPSIFFFFFIQQTNKAVEIYCIICEGISALSLYMDSFNLIYLQRVVQFDL